MQFSFTNFRNTSATQLPPRLFEGLIIYSHFTLTLVWGLLNNVLLSLIESASLTEDTKGRMKQQLKCAVQHVRN